MRAAEGVGPNMGCCLEANNPILLQPHTDFMYIKPLSNASIQPHFIRQKKTRSVFFTLQMC